MISVSFSLTERFVIDPVLSLRAPLLPDPEKTIGCCEKIAHFIQSEIVARIRALFASVFAALDAGIHLSAALLKGSYLVLSKCICLSANWNGREVAAHIARAIQFTKLALVGSIVAVVWPTFLKQFRYAPEAPEDGLEVIGAPDEILRLAQEVKEDRQMAPFRELKDFWKQSTLGQKKWFVNLFNQNHNSYSEVRQALADTVYRPLQSYPVSWLNTQEIAARVDGLWSKNSPYSSPAFSFTLRLN